ncbi:FAD-dependent oxidoreductase [Sinorhizobium meliloti]|uniref:FAD-dependent oxidoreductase n=1 Tax=Rhizobium meliloti TaxID=382 RepID=UPI0002FED4D8|nr:FAD-dependent oxidoreductase [Sinorhizobium meliloti]MDE3761436.1 FAD-dependent oxidoreductase [Sinorhizobium meliloti]
MAANEIVDIVIVGGGGSGLFAANEAAEMGDRVVVLEKNPRPGGMTVWSIGSFTSSNSPFQLAKGIHDSPEEHFEDMALFHGKLLERDNPALRRLYVDNAPETLRKLIDMGIVFMGPMPEPPHRAPRMHNVLPNSRAYGRALYRKARSVGVDVRLETRATKLIMQQNAVIGAEIEHKGTVSRIFSRKGVVLAGGDFSASTELKAQFAGPVIANVDALVTTSTGDAHRLGMQAGGQMVNGDVLSGPQIRFIPPKRNLITMLPPLSMLGRIMKLALEKMPPALVRPFIMMFLTTVLEPQKSMYRAGAILVNRNGDRFTDECEQPQLAISSQPGKEAFIIIDGELAQKFSAWPNFVSTAPGVAYAYIPDYKRNRKDVYREAGTIKELARKIGVPAEALQRAIGQFNATRKNGGLTKPPFIALGPVRSWVLTEGGLRVSERLEVLDASGEAIPGLFAAGATGTGGIILEGHGHHLGWAFTSGMLAGRAASSNPARALTPNV